MWSGTITFVFPFLAVPMKTARTDGHDEIRVKKLRNESPRGGSFVFWV